MRLNTLLLGILFAIAMAITACAPMRFTSLPQIETPKTGTLTILSAEPSYYDLKPNTKLVDDGTPINLVLYIDASGSMTSIKDTVKQTLTKLIQNFKGVNLNLFINDLSSHSTQKIIAKYTVDSEGTVTNYSSDLQVPAGTFYNKIQHQGIFPKAFDPSKSLSDYSNASSILYTFSADQMTETKEVIASGVLAKVDKLFSSTSNYQSNLDTPLCGMLRNIKDLSAGKITQAVNPNSPTLFMVISNEDDESRILASTNSIPTISGYTPYQSGLADKICIEDLIEKRTKLATRIINTLSYYYPAITLNPAKIIVDGAPQISTNFPQLSFVTSTHGLNYSADIMENSDCMGTFGADLTAIQARFNSTCSTYKCTATNEFTVASCKISKHQNGIWAKQQSVETSPDGIYPDFCPEVEAGIASFPKAIPGSCRQIVSSGSANFDKYLQHTSIISDELIASANGSSAQVLSNYISSLPNFRNFYYTAIINPSESHSDTCSLTEGARIGTKYEELANLRPDQSKVIPICSDSYGDQILQMAEKMKYLAVADFTIPAELLDQVGKVELISEGVTKQVILGVDYQIVDGRILFNKNLSTTDVVRIYKSEPQANSGKESYSEPTPTSETQ